MEHVTIRGIVKPVSRIALGTWAMGGWCWGGSDEKESIAAIQAALDRGITLIDTAPVYGLGTCEALVGKALAGRRDKAVIATKCGLVFDDGVIKRNSGPARIRLEIERSLQALNVEQIDLYQVHWPDEATPFDETARELELLQQEGKIGAVGLSNFTAEMMESFGPLAVSLQSPFNLFEQEIAEKEIPYCHRHAMVVLAYGPLCRGLLTGKMTLETSFAKDDIRNSDPKFQSPRFEAYLKCIEKLSTWAQDHYQKPIGALAVRYVLDAGCDIALWGCRRPEQLALTDEVWGWELTPEDQEEINEIVQATTQPVGPEFMAPQRSKV